MSMPSSNIGNKCSTFFSVAVTNTMTKRYLRVGKDFINFYFQVTAQEGEKLGHKVKEPEAETLAEHI